MLHYTYAAKGDRELFLLRQYPNGSLLFGLFLVKYVTTYIFEMLVHNFCPVQSLGLYRVLDLSLANITAGLEC